MTYLSTPERFSWKSCADGSRTIFDAKFGESFKSSNAAKSETWHVFIAPGILEHPSYQTPATNYFCVLELGFGVGTNFRSLQEFAANQEKEIIFTSIEKDLSGAKFFLASNSHEATKNIVCEASTQSKNFKAQLLKADFFTQLPKLESQSFDCIFFDPFSPKANAEAWCQEIFQECYRVLKPEGRLATYSVSRTAKDALVNAGLHFEKRALPKILQKRSSLLAYKSEKGSK